MAVNFPQNPSEGDQFTSGNFVYVYSNGKWVSAGNTQSLEAIIGATGATGPQGASSGGGGGADGVRYQQGTWTPLLKSNDGVRTATDYGSQIGNWTRVGNTVTAYFTVYLDSATGLLTTDELALANFPYTSFDGVGGSYGSSATVHANGLQDGEVIFVNMLMGPNASTTNPIYYHLKTGPGAPYSQLTYAQLGTGSLISQITYEVDDTTFVPINGAVVTEDIQGTGGSGGGGTTEIYGTAKAWAKVGASGVISKEYNIDRVEVNANGNSYTCFFKEPMPYANYVVNATTTTTSSGQARVRNQTVDSFDVVTSDWNGGVLALGFGVTVHDNEPVTVSGGSGTTINYNGASAWGTFNGSSAVLTGSLNVASLTRISDGAYSVTYKTPMPNSDYSLVVSSNNNSTLYSNSDKTANGFNVYTYNNAGDLADAINVSFAVHAESAIAPPSGVGADAWGRVASGGGIAGSYNIASVTKTGTGTYDIVFTTPMPIVDYSAVATCITGATDAVARTSAYKTTGFSVNTISTGDGSNVDRNFCFTVHASSTVTPTYTWTRDGTTLKPANAGDGVNISAASSGTNDDIFIVSATQGVTYQGQVSYTSNADLIGYAVDFSGQSPIPEKWKLSRDGTATFAKSILAEGYFNRAGGSGSSSTSIFNMFWTGSAMQLWVDTTNLGNINITSDYRAKRNVVSLLDGATERVKRLRPISYQWQDFGIVKEDDQVLEGFIAHEVQEVIPSGAIGEKDCENQLQSLKLDGIVSVLTKALQESITRIEALEETNAALETRLSELEG